MPPTSNDAAELLDQLWRQRQQSETAPGQPAGPDAKATPDVGGTHGSAIRGLMFGLPLAIALWGMPVIVWLYTGNPWLGAAACCVEFGLAAWLVWAKRGPAQSRRLR